MKNYIILKLSNSVPATPDMKSVFGFLESNTTSSQVAEFKEWIDGFLPSELTLDSEFLSIKEMMLKVNEFPNILVYNEELGSDKLFKKIDWVENDDPVQYKNIRGYFSIPLSDEPDDAVYIRDWKALSVKFTDGSVIDFKTFE